MGERINTAGCDQVHCLLPASGVAGAAGAATVLPCFAAPSLPAVLGTGVAPLGPFFPSPFAVAYNVNVQTRRRRILRKRVVKQVKSNFKSYKLDILKYISEQPWNHFSVAQLTHLYDTFAALLANPQRGVLPISSLASIIRANGVDDEHVAHACARFFDLDGNWQVRDTK